MDLDDNNIVKLVPRSRYVYLSYSVYGSFSHNPELRKASGLLEEMGCHEIGHLIQFKEQELLQLTFMSQSILDAMKTQLKEAKLEFGMRALDWKKPALSR